MQESTRQAPASCACPRNASIPGGMAAKALFFEAVTELDQIWALPAGAEIDSGFVRLHAYWRGKVTQDRLPGRAALDPLEIPRDLLQDLVLLDVEDGPPRRYRFRLFGSGAVVMAGRELTGKYYQDIVEPSGWPEIAAVLDRAVDGRRPGFLLGHTRMPTSSTQLYGRLALPLASDGHRVDMLLGMVRVVAPA